MALPPREAKPQLLRQPDLLEWGRVGWVWDVSLRWGSSQQAVGIRDGMKLLLQEPLEGRSTRVPVPYPDPAHVEVQ